jgi:hypothetical protein
MHGEQYIKLYTRVTVSLNQSLVYAIAQRRVNKCGAVTSEKMGQNWQVQLHN